MEPLCHVPVWNTPALIELLDADLGFIQLPAFRLDKGGDGLGGEEGLRAARTFGQRLESLFRIDVDPNRKCCANLCCLYWNVYILTHAALARWCSERAVWTRQGQSCGLSRRCPVDGMGAVRRAAFARQQIRLQDR